MKKHGGVLLGILLGIGFFLALLAGLLYYFGVKAWETTWVKGDTITGPDGYTYCILYESGLMQDPSDKLIRTKDLRAEKSFEELGQKSMTFSWLSVVRPADTVKGDKGQLYLIPPHIIVAVSYINKAAFAYDIDNHQFYGEGTIDTMSPFMLIGKDTPLYEPDVFAVILRVAEDYDFTRDQILHGNITMGREYIAGCPRPLALKDGLNHPNKEVNKLSKWLLEIQNHGLSGNSEITREIIEYSFARLDSTKTESKLYVIKILGYSMDAQAIKAIPILEKIVLSKNVIDSEAVMSLGRIGSPAFPFLSDCLKSKDNHIRWLGLLGFRFAGYAGHQVNTYQQEIRALLNDRDSGIRQQAQLALESIGKNQ